MLPDLTTGRQRLLEYATVHVNVDSDGIRDMAIDRVVEYVFIDLNFRLKIKSKFGKFYAFNSEADFFSVISRVDFEHTASSGLMNDENSCEVYY